MPPHSMTCGPSLTGPAIPWDRLGKCAAAYQLGKAFIESSILGDCLTGQFECHNYFSISYVKASGGIGLLLPSRYILTTEYLRLAYRSMLRTCRIISKVRGMAGHLGALASKVDNKIRCLRDALAEYRNIRNVIDGVTEEKERLYQEKERFKQEEEMLKQEKERLQRDLLAFIANREALEAMKEDLLASKNTMIAASDAITSQTEKISQQDEELEVLKRKLQESEAKNNQADQQCGRATAPIQPRRGQTRSMDKRKRPSEGALDFGAYDNEYIGQVEDQSLSHLVMENQNVQNRSVELSERNVCNEVVNKQTSGILVCNNEELESVRNELIKGFLEIDTGGRKLGIREMGELDEKAFKAACLAKLPPEEVGTGYYKLYTSWQKQLSDLSWNPFKTVMIDGNCQEMVDVDDDKLQELKKAWGEGPHDAVVRALMEMQEYDRLSDRSIAYELWNYKEGRKATTREGIEYMCSQVKQLSVTKRRKTRSSCFYSVALQDSRDCIACDMAAIQEETNRTRTRDV
ncbi:hypothetical protein EJB05_11170 [Eragrostis curvula]|uniref:Factor of DNA methylation 1-5/IDN2 domain-containing protein n=1 Tax=Eragrostis curvula TaxID=38414 RepID=A0A5J9VRT7_9POAL|nr:hypothetical protein EJB05_11170 [Eragrostis curvula]